MYAIRYDRAETLLLLTLTGMWTLDVAARFQAEMIVAAAAATKAAGRLRILSDCRDFPVQSREVTDAIADGPPSDPSRPSHTAVVVGSALGRMQANRTISNDRVRIFTDLNDARAWLLSC